MPDALSVSRYPGLDPADAGELPNIIYGKVENVRAHLIEGGATALLVSGISEIQTTLQVLDASRFPSAPFTVQVGYERMLVDSVSSDTFTVTRACDNTEASAHSMNKTLYEVCTEYVYLVSEEPVKNIKRVMVDTHAQAAGACTPYTGQSDDEHARYPGKAVVSFTAEAWIGPQRGLDPVSATRREKGEDVTAHAAWASHPELTDGADSSHATLSETGTHQARVVFKASAGVIRQQSYTIKLDNVTASDSILEAVVSDSLTGAVLLKRTVEVPALSAITFKAKENSQSTGTTLTLVLATGAVKVISVTKIVKRLKLSALEESLSTIEPAPSLVSDFRLDDGTDSAQPLSSSGKLMAWVSYDTTGPGAAVTQTHRAELLNPGASEAHLKLMAVEPDGTCRNISTHRVSAGAVELLELEHTSGAWGTHSVLKVVSGEIDVRELSKTVSYTTEETLASRTLAHSASARAVIGKNITVDLEGALDTDGSYAGVGTLIERPDHVIKHFIINQMGFSAGDINATAFSTAGTSYSSAVTGGYKFGFLFSGDMEPSGFVRRLAQECRSTVNYSGGKWKLTSLPFSAPAAVKTISKDDLAGFGAMFAFRATPSHELANSITVSYRRNIGAGRSKSKWLMTASVEDAASKTLYGQYAHRTEFLTVRDKATADDVLSHMLLQRKTPLLTATFTVFYEHFDLQVGDTIDIANDLYNGKKFFIEQIERIDPFRARITAKEWWS